MMNIASSCIADQILFVKSTEMNKSCREFRYVDVDDEIHIE